MSRVFIRTSLALAALLLIWAGMFYFQNLRGVGPIIKPPPEDITKILNTTGMPLTLPPGFSIEILAKNLPGARVLAFDTLGNLWISQTSEGKISLLEIEGGAAKTTSDIFKDLRKPHGLAIDPKDPFALYFAEEDKVSRVRIYSEGRPEKILDLPAGGRHFTRTLGFGLDDRLYIAISSSCDVCQEKDAFRAKIFSLNRDGSDFKEFARGLRNTVFFMWDEGGRMWGTDMGRDLLGDNLPPDEINIIEEGENYGWPICYGKNIHDTAFDKNTYIRNPCMEPFETGSYIDIPAHSAPLGLVFIPESWPEEYRGDLLVAYHGSWNRSEPTGYKVVRFEIDERGNPAGEGKDFISGWLTKDGALGRPVDLKIGPDSALYISDDKAGVIYRVTPSTSI